MTSVNETKARKKHIMINAGLSGVLASFASMSMPENNGKITNFLSSHASSFEVQNMSPLDAVAKGVELGSSDIASLLLFTASAYCLTSAVSEKILLSEKASLIDYGRSYCPYKSHIDYKNDFRSKIIYKVANKVEFFTYTRDRDSKVRKTLLGIKDMLLKYGPHISLKHRHLMDFFNRPDLGTLALVHHNKKYDNPKFVNQLIIPKELKDEIREDLMDIGCSDRVENRKFTQDVINSSTRAISDEVEERNVNLSLVRLIDEIKMNKIDNKKASSIFRDIMGLNISLSTEKKENYKDLRRVAEYIFIDKKIKNLNIKGYSEKQGKMKRAYYIMLELDRICHQELKIAPLKKPLSYREIVANETVMSVQRMLRGRHADDAIHNKMEQDRSPLYKSHYFKNKDLEKSMDKNRFGGNKNGYYKLISRDNFKICGIDKKERKSKRRRFK